MIETCGFRAKWGKHEGKPCLKRAGHAMQRPGTGHRYAPEPLTGTCPDCGMACARQSKRCGDCEPRGGHS